MDSTIIRAFAIMLALTGFSATSYTGGTSTTGAPTHTRMDDGGPSPIPTCPLNDPNYCGLR